MSWDIRSFMPNRISGQIAIIIIASLATIHMALTTAYFVTRSDQRPDRPRERLVTVVDLLDASPIAARPRLMTEIAGAFPNLRLKLLDSLPDGAVQADGAASLASLQRRLGSTYHVVSLAPDAPSHGASNVAVRLKDGAFLTARMAARSNPPLFGTLTVTLLTIATSITLLGLWAARGLTDPLRRFARAAEHFSPHGEIAPLPERGPFEIRAAARALNQMRERIKGLIDDRTRMLAAVSHDLRTPITRLRLRCEFIEDGVMRDQMLDELAHMNTMVEGVLNFLRDGESREQAATIDLATSLQTICDQFADTGRDVRYSGPNHVVIRAKAAELQRAITNLIDNATRYGRKVDVRLTQAAPSVIIAIEDDGPGIADRDKAAMLEPFVRGDEARGMNQGGFGLGLSIARAVIEAHGGTLTLLDRAPSGLVARVTLPVSDQNARQENLAGHAA
jgi:signal transduction histidine kinase